MYENTTAINNKKMYNLGVIKGVFKTKKLIAIAILDLLIVISTFLAASVSVNLLKNAEAGAISASTSIANHSQLLDTLTNFFSSSVYLSVLPQTIVSLAVIFANIFIFAKCRSNNESATPKAGIIIQFVVAIMDLVVCSLYSLLMLFVAMTGSLSTMLIARDGSDAALSAFVPVFMTIFSAIMIFLMLFISINKVRYINSIRSGLNGEALSRKGAKPTGVIYVICSVFFGLYALLMMFFTTMFILSTDSLTALSGIDMTPVVYLLLIALAVMIIYFIGMILRAKIAFDYSSAVDSALFTPNPYNDGFNSFGSTDGFVNPTPVPVEPAMPISENVETPVVSDTPVATEEPETPETPVAEPTANTEEITEENTNN